MTDYMYNKRMCDNMDKINRIMEKMIDDTNDFAMSHREKRVNDFPYLQRHVIDKLEQYSAWINDRLDRKTKSTFTYENEYKQIES